jgi:hypothetical protein
MIMMEANETTEQNEREKLPRHGLDDGMACQPFLSSLPVALPTYTKSYNLRPLQ